MDVHGGDKLKIELRERDAVMFYDFPKPNSNKQKGQPVNLIKTRNKSTKIVNYSVEICFQKVPMNAFMGPPGSCSP